MNNNYLKNDTIVALSTAIGKSAIAVIRLSGRDSFKIINKIFKTNSKNKMVKHGYIVDGTKIKDEVICIFFESPNTYTGENLVEISVHGSSIIIQDVLDLAHKNGARYAEPGEFTYRAFINGKMDLAKAEAVCSLITSKNKALKSAALNNINGALSSKIKNIIDSLTNLVVFIEADIDHPHDNITQPQINEKFSELDLCIANIKQLVGFYKTSASFCNATKIVIIGKPNVGKSSLLNSVLGKDRAIVTKIAGTTTDTIEETIDRNGINITFVDTAGIRSFNGNKIEFFGQKKTKESILKANILIWLFDSSCNLDENDLKIAKFLKKINNNKKTIIVLNKSDLKKKLSFFDIVTSLKPRLSTHLSISTKTGIGIEKLLNKIDKLLHINKQHDCLMVNSRHNNLLKNATKALINARKILHTNHDEIVCIEISNAITSLNEILGINTTQDVLNKIFSTFCIGK